MPTEYTRVADAKAQIQIQKDSIVSRTLFTDAHVKAVLMALDTGQELSEHTASMPAIVQFLQGEAVMTLGEDKHTLAEGAWIHMPANHKHSVLAKSPVILLLLLLKSAKE